MSQRKEFLKEYELSEKIMKELKIADPIWMYSGYWIDVVERRLKFLKGRTKPSPMFVVEEIEQNLYNIKLCGFDNSIYKIRFNRNSNMLQKFAVLVGSTGLNHNFIANELDMNVSTFRKYFYENAFKIRQVQSISKMCIKLSKMFLEASVMDVSFEEFKETEGSEYLKESDLTKEERKKFEQYAGVLGYIKMKKTDEYVKENLDTEEKAASYKDGEHYDKSTGVFAENKMLTPETESIKKELERETFDNPINAEDIPVEFGGCKIGEGEIKKKPFDLNDM